MIGGPRPVERPGARAEADARAPGAAGRGGRPTRRSTRDLDDNVELIELGEAEGDEDDRRRGRGGAEGACATRRRRSRDRGAAERRGRRQRHLPRNQRGRGRHRKLRLGRRCWRACTCAGPRQHGYKVELSVGKPGRRGGHQVGRLQDQRPERLWLAQVRNRACTGSSASRPTTARRGGIPRSPRSGSIRWSTTTSRSTSPTRTSGSTPTAPRARAASTSTPPTRRCGSRTCPPNIVVTSSMKSQHQNRETAMNALRARLYQLELDKRNAAINAAARDQGRRRLGQPDPLLRAAALPDGEGPAHGRTRPRTRRACSTAISTRFMAATLALDVAGKSRSEAQAAG